MKTFEEYQDEMYFCYRDDEAFNNKSGAFCYIPENAESLDDAFTYSDLKNEVVSFLNENTEYLKEHETDLESVLENMYMELSWEFPSTFLNQLDY
jgi:hypothetical protein